MQSGGKYLPWKEFIKAGERYAWLVDEPYGKDRPVVMVYSSGTTGASKGIQLTNDGINATIVQYYYMTNELSRQMSFLHIVPIWFSTGIVISLLMPLCLGMMMILEPILDNRVFVRDVCKYKPNHVIGSTSMWLFLIKSDRIQKMDLSFLQYPIQGGEQLSVPTEVAINSFLYNHGCRLQLQKGYGMCELGSTISTTSPIYTKPGSVGYPILGASVAAFDMDTNLEMPYGQHGELRAVSPCRMLGYYKNPAATAEFFRTDKDGQVWGCTGDIGYVDEDGNVFVLGRASDCYTAPDGKRHYLFDAENVILQDEAVDLCEVVDIPLDGLPVPVAHLLLNKECQDAPEEIVRRVDALCRAQLDPYAVPRGYKIRESFAVKPSGKRDAEALRAERDGFLNGQGNPL